MYEFLFFSDFNLCCDAIDDHIVLFKYNTFYEKIVEYNPK